ncbi:MAG: hypothetical protein SNJ67_10290 [Chloracidobacterium sp.]|uniref:Uncharacterized protein n=1 Tax=Chloracidobacterium validum TaxID=2821543 RepID=A0ABX8BA97_9BACT|nr:hypothetical protein [Chloracidobacterium validum]QUW03851.1 hypothetical protein J8C06_05335 [Chloracidobacterium validum]
MILKTRSLVLGLVAAGVLGSAALYGSLPARSQGAVDNPIPVSALTTTTLDSVSTDCGVLTKADLALSSSLEETFSSRYVIEGATGDVLLPVTGEKACIGVFVDDETAKATLLTPNGGRVPTQDVPRDTDLGTALSRQTEAVDGKVEATPRDFVSQPGYYRLRIEETAGARRKREGMSGAPRATVVVNDNARLILRTWLTDNLIDARQTTEIHAQVLDGEQPVEKVKATARIYHENGTLVLTREMTALGSGDFGLKIRPTQLGRFGKVIIDAEGVTAGGLAFKRTGLLEIASGVAGGRLMRIVGERMTEQGLELDMEYIVTRSGRFHARANLVTVDGDPVAWAQAAAEAAVGRHVLTLRFDRRLLPAGKLVLRDVELTDVTEFPGVKSPTRIGTYAIERALQ